MNNNERKTTKARDIIMRVGFLLNKVLEKTDENTELPFDLSDPDDLILVLSAAIYNIAFWLARSIEETTKEKQLPIELISINDILCAATRLAGKVTKERLSPYTSQDEVTNILRFSTMWTTSLIWGLDFLTKLIDEGSEDDDKVSKGTKAGV